MRILIFICLFGFVLSECDDPNQTEYLIDCGGGSFQQEMSWSLDPPDINGGAPYTEYICLYDDEYELRMFDSWGDGWNGNIWSLYKGDFDGDLIAQCTLETGASGQCFFDLGTPLPPESCEESNQTECENDDTCQWVNNTIIGSCSGLSSQECYTIPECNWACSQWGSWYSWICYGTYYCAGGNYQTNNSYCEDIDFMQGDLNGDFIHNILDILVMIDLIINNINNDLADMNEDGIIDILDVIVIINIILGE